MESKSLPDVASEKALTTTTLNWVGMSEIQLPLQYQNINLSGRASAQVNILPNTSRGIHMSRLYQVLIENLATQNLNTQKILDVNQMMLNSQGEISDRSRLSLSFELPLTREALKSGLLGHRLYPVTIMSEATTAKPPQLFISFEVQYSSTCPASTALSLEVLKTEALGQDQQWLQNLNAFPATPHAQRSKANIKLEVKPNSKIEIAEWITKTEKTLSTPVQTFVKRMDEQEFARLNGQNPMFCEDAARRVQAWLKNEADVVSYHAKFEHQESLHPHNAVSEISG
jgi:GTP cyclohydrolase IB